MARSTRSTTTRSSRDEDVNDDVNETTEEDEAPAPRSSRRSRSTSDEDDAPRRSSRRSRSSADDEDEDEGSKKPKKVTASGGWGEFKKNREETRDSKFPEWWKPTAEESLVKFLEDEPFASYGLHWLDELPKGTRKGWECIKPIEGDRYGKKGECPLCDLLDSDPKMQVLFNIVVFDIEEGDNYGEYKNRVLKCGVTLTEQLQGLADGERTGPLSKHYWDITATGNSGTYSANCNVVKERDLPTDWDIEPLTEEDLEEAREAAFGSDLIKYPTVAELKKITEKVLG